MCDHPARDKRQILLRALDHLRSALTLLDEADAPGQIGAHIDLALHQLEDAIGAGAGKGPEPSDRQKSTRPMVN